MCVHRGIGGKIYEKMGRKQLSLGGRISDDFTFCPYVFRLFKFFRALIICYLVNSKKRYFYGGEHAYCETTKCVLSWL